MANPRFNKQVAQPRVSRKGGGMGGRSGDMMYARGQGVLIVKCLTQSF